jgi:hypothetical protein
MNEQDKEKVRKLLIKSGGSKVLEDLIMYVTAIEDDIDNYRESNRRLREDYNKDDEIVKLKKEIEDIRKKSFLTLDDVELKAYKEFSSKHYESCYKRRRGTTHVEFYGTGLGDVIIVKCPICNETEDITNVDNW